MGIFHRGDDDLVITDQAIGTGSTISAGTGDSTPGERPDRARPQRSAVGTEAKSGSAVVNNDVINTGTGRVTITNACIGGKLIRNRKF